MAACGHPLCEQIGGACSLATARSRGCRPVIAARTTSPEVFAEVRVVLAAIETGSRAAAVRLAEIIRREALDERYLLAQARIEEPELAPALERLVTRRRS
jgi:hypothetical protein